MVELEVFFLDIEETLETIYLPNPFYRIDDLNQLELQMRITSTKHIWENPVKNLMYLINTQKCIQQLVSLQFFFSTHHSRTIAIIIIFLLIIILKIRHCLQIFLSIISAEMLPVFGCAVLFRKKQFKS